MKTKKQKAAPPPMILRDCGLHWGEKRPDGTNNCPKCAHFAKSRREKPECYQYGGTPWIAVIQTPYQP